MEVKKISTDKNLNKKASFRPSNFKQFVGQNNIKKVLQSSISSAKQRNQPIGHTLFAGPSGFGKTTLANIVANSMNVNIKIITGYAISKPSELISVLSNLQKGDILFIDEIHRLKAPIEEILYIAMEDFVIDMVTPEWDDLRVPIEPFSLLWATTKMQSLSNPLKNRFIYKFHFTDYSSKEKQLIIEKYLQNENIQYNKKLLKTISQNLVSVPREIRNFCIKLRDYLISQINQTNQLNLTDKRWQDFKSWANIQFGWLTHIHSRYIEILKEYQPKPVGLKTISLKLWINEKAVENDIEPLLLKQWKIKKTSQGRTLC